MKITSTINGRKLLQPFFEKMYRLSLAGMNIGLGGNIRNDGEIYAMNYIKDTLDLGKNKIIFDIGANVGKYTLLLAEIFTDSTIYAFEPSAYTFNELYNNIKSVGVNASINTYKMGFGDKVCEKTLYSNSHGSGLASLYQRKLEHFDIKMVQEEKVSITTIDSFCEYHMIDLIDFLKLDIEGNELNALKGAERMIQRDAISFIQFEFGGCNIDSRTYFQDFYYNLNNKYRIFRILKNGLYEIKNYDERCECFITTNFLAQHKGVI